MPTSTPSHRLSPAIGSCGYHWGQAFLLQAALVALLLSARLCSARPFAEDFGPAVDFAPSRSLVEAVWGGRGGEGGEAGGAGEGEGAVGLDLRSLCAQTQSVEMRVLCRLTQQARPVPAGEWGEPETRTKLVNKRSDSSSLSAFQRHVSQLQAAAENKADALRRLQTLKSMGVIDSNNQVVSLPDETRSLMETLG